LRDLYTVFCFQISLKLTQINGGPIVDLFLQPVRPVFPHMLPIASRLGSNPSPLTSNLLDSTNPRLRNTKQCRHFTSPTTRIDSRENVTPKFLSVSLHEHLLAGAQVAQFAKMALGLSVARSKEVTLPQRVGVKIEKLDPRASTTFGVRLQTVLDQNVLHCLTRDATNMQLSQLAQNPAVAPPRFVGNLHDQLADDACDAWTSRFRVSFLFVRLSDQRRNVE